MRLAGLLHDLGKIAIPDRILQKPGKLDAEECGPLREHPELGYRLLEGLGVSPVDRWIRHHHECWDGSGYPHGLAGEDIPLGSRIILVADAFDAMTTDRAYRAAARATRSPSCGALLDAVRRPRRRGARGAPGRPATPRSAAAAADGAPRARSRCSASSLGLAARRQPRPARRPAAARRRAVPAAIGLQLLAYPAGSCRRGLGDDAATALWLASYAL